MLLTLWKCEKLAFRRGRIAAHLVHVRPGGNSLLTWAGPSFSPLWKYKPSTTQLYSTLRTFSSRVLVTLSQHRLMPVVSRELISRDMFERWHSYRLRNIVQNPVIIVEQTTASHLKPFTSLRSTVWTTSLSLP